MSLTPLLSILGIEFHILELVTWFFIFFAILSLLGTSSASLIIYTQKYTRDLTVFGLGAGLFLLSILCSHILGTEFDAATLFKALAKWIEIFLLATLFYLIIRSVDTFRAVYIFLISILCTDVLVYLIDIGFISRTFDYTSLRSAPAYSALFLVSLLAPFVQKSGWIKLAIAVLSVVIVASLSRGAILGVGLFFLYILLSGRTSVKSIVPILGSMVVGLLLVYMLMAPEQRDYFADTLTRRFSLGATASNVERQGLTNEAISLFRSHPVFGIGAENFSSYLSLGYSNMNYISATEIDNLTPHNFFLQVAAEQGTVGLISLVLWLGGTLGVLRQFSRGAAQTPQLQRYYFGLQLVLFAFLIQLALGYMAGGFRIVLGVYLGLVLTLSKLHHLHSTASTDRQRGGFQHDYRNAHYFHHHR